LTIFLPSFVLSPQRPLTMPAWNQNQATYGWCEARNTRVCVCMHEGRTGKERKGTEQNGMEWNRKFFLPCMFFLASLFSFPVFLPSFL
jgi:hypothetical protein